MADDHATSKGLSPLTEYETRGLRIVPDSLGNADFVDGEGHSVCVVYVERNADGTYTVHVEPAVADELSLDLSVELHLEAATHCLGGPAHLGENEGDPHCQDSR